MSNSLQELLFLQGIYLAGAVDVFVNRKPQDIDGLRFNDGHDIKC